MKDVLDILLDILEDETSEMKLTKDNIKAFVFVSLQVMIKDELNLRILLIKSQNFCI